MNIRREDGQAAALTVVFMIVLLASAAAVLDVGSWFRADRDTQRVADAAALAGAQALPEDPGQAQGWALDYSGKNGGGVAPAGISFSSRMMPNDTINVKLERAAPGFFSKVFGIDSVTVGSKASARAGVPSEARWAAPFAVDEKHPMLQCKPHPCWGEATDLDLKKTGPGAFRVLNIDGSRGGTGTSTLAVWIQKGYDGYMPLKWYWSDPGAKFDSSNVQNALGLRENTELLFPVYRRVQGQGSNFEYEIIGWAGFYVTRFDLRGNAGKIYGHFTRMIWEGLLSTSGASEDFGVRSVALID
jgi:hypothetical protein